MDNTEQAKDTAKYYFRLIAEQAGIKWNSDNDMEIENLIDHIIHAAVEKVHRDHDMRWQNYGGKE